MKKLIYTVIVVAGVLLIGKNLPVFGGAVLGVLGVLAVRESKEEVSA